MWKRADSKQREGQVEDGPQKWPQGAGLLTSLSRGRILSKLPRSPAGSVEQKDVRESRTLALHLGWGEIG